MYSIELEGGLGLFELSRCILNHPVACRVKITNRLFVPQSDVLIDFQHLTPRHSEPACGSRRSEESKFNLLKMRQTLRCTQSDERCKFESMKIKLIAYGIAKDILQTNSLDLEVSDSASILDVKRSLVTQFPEFEKLQSLKLAVNEDYQYDDFTLQPNDEVVIIPPVSGG